MLAVQATFGAGSRDAADSDGRAAKPFLKSFVPIQTYSGGSDNPSLASQAHHCSPDDFTAVAKLLKPLLDNRQGATLAEIRDALGLKPHEMVPTSKATEQGEYPTFVLTATTQVSSPCLDYEWAELCLWNAAEGNPCQATLSNEVLTLSLAQQPS